MAGMQDKDIYKRPYVRPNENWVCGRSAEGRPCPHGPSTRGKCTAQHECKPAQVGDRWVCTRPEQYGGPCDDPALPDPSFGPLVVRGVGVCCRKVHCTPQRSIRAKRGRLSVILCTAIVGIVLFALGSPWRDSFISPGPLTAAHQGASMASLEDMAHGKMDTGAAPADRDGCHICHTAADGGLTTMFASAIARDEAMPQSNQCLVCHGEEIGESALFAHALEPDVLALHTAAAAAEPFDASRPLSLALASLSPGVKTGAGGQMACASCHREHNGALFDLKHLDNQQCQSCHVKQFDSLAAGHPVFSTAASSAGYDYPYRRRTRIVYDHASHETDYFLRAENLAHAPADCMACHEIGDGAPTTALRPFEQMCAACHTNNIVAGRDEWLHVLGYPSMEFDAYAVVEEETETRNVPRTARKGVSPFMLLLQSALHADDDAAATAFQADLATLEEFGGDLSGIVFDEDPEVAARLFGASQSVLNAASDAGGFRETGLRLLSAIRGAAVDPAQFDAMFGFPAAGDTVADVLKKVARRDIVEMSGWHVVESGYRVDAAAWAGALQGLEPFAALSAAAGDGDGGAYAEAQEFLAGFSDFKDWFNEHLLVQGEDWLLRASGKEAKKQDWEALLAGVLKTPAEPESAETAEDSGDNEAEDAEDPEDAADDAPEAAEPAPDAATTDLSEAGDAFLAWLGDMAKVKRWMEENFDISGDTWTLRAPQSLYYRPVQHADPFLTAWIDFAGSIYSENGAAAMLFDQLTGRREGLGIGACTKCHSIDVEKNMAGNTAVRVNWKSKPPNRDFTKFNHSPHLKLMDCAQCHRADWMPGTDELLAQMARAASAEEEAAAPESSGEAETDATAADSATAEDGAAPVETAAADAPPAMAYLDSFKAEKGSLEIGVNFSNRDHASTGYAFTSNFEPVTKEDCARCHVPGKAGDSCLVCHNYHVQRVDWSAGVRSLSELLAAKAPESGEPAADTEEPMAEEVPVDEAPEDVGDAPAAEEPAAATADSPEAETDPADEAAAE